MPANPHRLQRMRGLRSVKNDQIRFFLYYLQSFEKIRVLAKNRDTSKVTSDRQDRFHIRAAVKSGTLLCQGVDALGVFKRNQNRSSYPVDALCGYAPFQRRQVVETDDGSGQPVSPRLLNQTIEYGQRLGKN